MAVAAIAASVLIARGREVGEANPAVPLGGFQPEKAQLDAIRAAGW
ncbi:MAG TPA: hypothetical protein VK929_11445 [Longimicrobiales bacterium]|nr:hypothetical protein [Longimicrobiales bacterium]